MSERVPIDDLDALRRWLPYQIYEARHRARLSKDPEMVRHFTSYQEGLESVLLAIDIGVGMFSAGVDELRGGDDVEA